MINGERRNDGFGVRVLVVTKIFKHILQINNLPETQLKRTYRLYYWPMLPGRGEFIRLIFEDAGADYIDVGRLPEDEGGGISALRKKIDNPHRGFESFALPLLEYDDYLIAQLPNICLFLANEFNMIPGGNHYFRANQLMLTICDIIDEIHNTHHPLSISMYYENQQEAAKKNALSFTTERLPKWLQYLEKTLIGNGEKHLAGTQISYVDIALFQLIRGLDYAFPNHMQRYLPQIPKLIALKDRVGERPGICSYLSSERCIDFNNDGIFRAYPELDIVDRST